MHRRCFSGSLPRFLTCRRYWNRAVHQVSFTSIWQSDCCHTSSADYSDSLAKCTQSFACIYAELDWDQTKLTSRTCQASPMLVRKTQQCQPFKSMLSHPRSRSAPRKCQMSSVELSKLYARQKLQLPPKSYLGCTQSAMSAAAAEAYLTRNAWTCLYDCTTIISSFFNTKHVSAWTRHERTQKSTLDLC